MGKRFSSRSSFRNDLHAFTFAGDEDRQGSAIVIPDG